MEHQKLWIHWRRINEAPYKLSRAIVKLAGITFSRLAFSYWIDNLGFITERKLATIFIKTFSWGFPTGWLFTTRNQVFWHHHHRTISGIVGSYHNLL
jgi:hypothetical protein